MGELRKSEQSTEIQTALLEAISTAAVLIEKSGRIHASNSAFQLQSGWAKRSVVGFDLDTVLSDDGSQLCFQLMRGEKTEHDDCRPFPSINRYEPEVTALSGNLFLIKLNRVQAVVPGNAAGSDYWKEICDKSPIGIIVTEFDRTIVRVNEAFCLLIGYSKEELIGESTLSLTVKEQTAERDRQLKELLAGALPFAAIYKTYRHKDGSLVDVEAAGAVVEIEGTQYIIGYVIDISERTHAKYQLAKKNAILETILDYNSNLLVVKDIEGRIQLVNKAVTELIGRSNEDLLGKKEDELFGNHEWVKQIIDEDKEIIEKGITITTETVSIFDSNNKQQYLRIARRPYKDIDGNILGVFSSGTIVTEWYEAEQALVESQELSDVGSWHFNPTDQSMQWSNQLYRIFERDPKLSPITVEEFGNYIPENKRASLRKVVLDTIARGDSYEIVLPIRMHSGKLKWIKARGDAKKGADGLITRLQGTAQDITKGYELQKQIEENQTQLATALRMAELGVFRYKLEQNVIRIDERIADMFCYPYSGEPTEVSFDAFTLNVHREDRERLDKIITDGLTEGVFTETAFRILAPCRGIQHVRVTCSGIHDKSGKAIELTGVMRNITKEIEDQLRNQETRQDRVRLQWESKTREIELEENKAAHQMLESLYQEIKLKNKAISQQADHLKTINRQLSQQKREMEEQHKQITLISDNAPLGIAYLDVDLKIKLSNRWLKNLMGEPHSELGSSIRSFFGDEVHYLKMSGYSSLLQGDPLSMDWSSDIKRSQFQLDLIPQVDNYGSLVGIILLVTDVTEKKLAKNTGKVIAAATAKEIEAKLELNKIQSEKLKAQLKDKDRELTDQALFLANRIELVDKIRSITNRKTSKEEQFKLIQGILREAGTSEKAWDEFEMRFNHIQTDFYQRLSVRFPKLTKNELRLAAFLKLNMSTKQIAQVILQTPESIKVARSRLRKKLGLETGQNLNSFLSAID
ncbi:PAS domain S-box protein [Chitinophagales bacterium]|nr:PAS domain S-box protein [Chitinophagales bacterium]